jgi:hypothetical protein
MANELRKSYRRRLTIGAKISDFEGRMICGCHTRDVSDAGARLELATPDQVPNEFILTLENGARRPRCKVIWRNQYQVGVAFDD